MITVGKVKEREVSISLKGENVVDFCGFNGIIETSWMDIFPSNFDLDHPFVFRFIPRHASVWAFAIAYAIHLVLAASGYPQIGSAVIESVFSVYMVTFALIAIFQSKYLPMHVYALSIRRGSTCIPSDSVRGFAFPCEPFVFGDFLEFISVNDGNLILRQRNDAVFRGAHKSIVAEMKGV